MMGLWADGWFYISSAGLLVSGILFFFLLGQYRVASEAADATEGEQGAEMETSSTPVIRPVYIPEETPAPRIVSHAPEPKAEPKAEPKPEPKKAESESAGSERRKDPANTTGAISPAVVYLQNIKVELADLHKDLRSLAKRVDDELASVSTRDEALIERLGELTRAVEGMKAAARVEAQPAARAEAEPAAQSAPAEVVIEVLPPPEADAIPELKAAFSPAEPAPEAAEPAPAEPATPPEEKPRRGPVWPV